MLLPLARSLSLFRLIDDPLMAEIDASTHAAQVVAKLRAGFRAGLMRWPSARIEQLKKLAACVEHHHDDLCRALYKDLRKPVAESKITELSMVFTEIQLQIDNVRKWVKPTSVSNPSHLMYPLDSYVGRVCLCHAASS